MTLKMLKKVSKMGPKWPKMATLGHLDAPAKDHFGHTLGLF